MKMTNNIHDIRQKLHQTWPVSNYADQNRRPVHGNSKMATVRDLVRWRAARSAVLGSKLFDDPAWDILLYVYGAQLANAEPTFRDVASGLAMPVATLACWVRALEEEAFISRTPAADPEEGTLRLTDRGLGGMHALFEVLPAKRA